MIKSKLEGIGPILWINLDTESNRRKYMEGLLDSNGIPHTRISAVDTRSLDDLSNIMCGFPEMVTKAELGCTMSHIKAIKYFYEETDLDHVVICEDDISFDTVPHWPFTWKEFIKNAPYDWDVLQCSITCTKNLRVNLHPRLINDYCTVMYVITRHHASKIIKMHFKNGKFKLDQKFKPRAASEEVVYNSGKTYSIPLFIYRCDFNSSIHQDHIETFHKGNAEAILNFWKNIDPRLGAREMLDYDYNSFWAPLIG